MILQFLFKINRFISFYNKTNTQQSKHKKQMLKEHFLVDSTMPKLLQLKAQTLIEWIIFMAFGITSIFFTKEVFTNYYSKATSFKIYEEEMLMVGKREIQRGRNLMKMWGYCCQNGGKAGRYSD